MSELSHILMAEYVKRHNAVLEHLRAPVPGSVLWVESLDSVQPIGQHKHSHDGYNACFDGGDWW